MNHKKTLLGLGFFLIVSAISLFASGAAAPAPEPEAVKPEPVIVITPELRKKFPIKKHHANLSFDCVFCHAGQGDNPEEFKGPGDEGCMSCHKSKQYLAERLKFMDRLHVNPHNSIHDGPTLYCDECHFEHKPSINMCAECHSKDVKIWMRTTP